MITLIEGKGESTVTTNSVVDWVLIGVEVVGVATALIGGVGGAIAKSASKGVTVAADGASAASGAITATADTAVTTTELAADSLESGSELAATSAGAASNATKAAGWFLRFGKKIFTIGSAVAAAGGAVHVAIGISNKTGKGKFPKTILNDLMKDASSPVVWPHFKELEIKSLSVNGAIQFGGEVTYDV
jgi:hypothetical protein